MDWAVIAENIGFFARGLGFTVWLAALSIALSFPIGVFMAALRMNGRIWIRLPAVIYIEVFRGVPLILVIFWIYFLLPILLGRPSNAFSSAVAGFTVFTSAYIAEIVRSGINSIDRGQVEAALATGLTPSKAMRFVILPQAIRHMIPAIFSQFIALFKDTSLAYIIGVVELTKAAYIVNNREFRSFEIFLFVGVVYFLVAFSISRLSRLAERKWAIGQ